MLCSHCKKPIAETSKFCPYCGTPVKKKSLVWLWITLACLAVAGAGVGGFFIGKSVGTAESSSPSSRPSGGSDSRKTDSRSEEDSRSAFPASAVPDTKETVLAIAAKEWKELTEDIEKDALTMYSNDEEILQISLGYRDTVQTADPVYDLYSFSGDPLPSGNSPLETVAALVQNHINSYGTRWIAASSILRQLNKDNSYPYPWETDGLPTYAVEVSAEGVVRAVILIRFNEYHAVMTDTFPLFGASDFSLAEAVKTADLKKDLSFVHEGTFPSQSYEEVLSLLVPSSSSNADIEDLIGHLAQAIAEKADPDYLKERGIPDDLFNLCLRCAVFAEKPFRVIRWDLSAPSPETLLSLLGVEDVSEEEKERLLSSIPDQMPAFLNSGVGSSVVSSASIMSQYTAVSFRTDMDELYWYCWEGDDGLLVLSVRTKTNANGCVDIMATPVYAVNEVLDLLDAAEDDTLSFEDLVRVLSD